MREFIVEADGGSRGNPGLAGYGSVVIDAATGETLVERAEYLGVATNNVAEYRGLVAGLRAARELDPSASVRVRMDSKLVVEQMSGRWKIKHPDMKPLAAEASRVFPPTQVTYEWIPRDRNKHADRLANEAMDAGRRGEAWSPSASTAELDARAARSAVPEPSGPPGDAAAGAAKARAALAEGRAPVAARPRGGAAKAEADVRAAGNVATGPSEAPPGEAGTTPAPAVGWGASPDLGAPATFVLLRHGETPLTPQKRFSGSGGSDPSLSDVGREQAERVAAALAARGTIQAIVSSPLTRTRETAGAIAARLGLDVVVEEGLRETDFGAWEGLTFGEVRERYPDDLDAWLASPKAEPTGGGESFAATARRIAATRDKLTAAYAGRTVLLVSHVTPIKTLVRLALGAPPESMFRMELSAASLSAVAYYADGNASVRLFNDTSHLR
ncbi:MULTISPECIES: bifunctional RNase H/acid phosphatase [Streptomyces]|uniref:Bifunctional RNase H/acid phosphatase n=1 Tax=Streptomyces dengpaensis TaxID=2049881 RepID=A0ABM6SWD5_9ACTN|nr:MULTISPECIES: bifunctional RNase H/acid phosphatase [Streptomyces]AVH59026.1 bifunctional RNase H/acid phosphatase [Streptomyces dengpaensis]PIB05953.1 bifunctional RNase H/acid phosphatase [Streptomyces sp. HG99]